MWSNSDTTTKSKWKCLTLKCLRNNYSKNHKSDTKIHLWNEKLGINIKTYITVHRKNKPSWFVNRLKNGLNLIIDATPMLVWIWLNNKTQLTWLDYHSWLNCRNQWSIAKYVNTQLQNTGWSRKIFAKMNGYSKFPQFAFSNIPEVLEI